jgi:hypothetical protein
VHILLARCRVPYLSSLTDCPLRAAKLPIPPRSWPRRPVERLGLFAFTLVAVTFNCELAERPNWRIRYHDNGSSRVQRGYSLPRTSWTWIRTLSRPWPLSLKAFDTTLSKPVAVFFEWLRNSNANEPVFRRPSFTQWLCVRVDITQSPALALAWCSQQLRELQPRTFSALPSNRKDRRYYRIARA